jgi:integrase
LNTTLKDLFDLVLQKYLDNEQKSLVTVTNHIEHLKLFYGEWTESDMITHTKTYREHRQKQGIKHSTINRELSTFRLAYSLGIEHGLINRKPVIKMTDERKNIRKGFFEIDDYQKQLTAISQIKIQGKDSPVYLKNLLRFAYLCGWRQGEIFLLTWADNYDATGHCLRLWDSKSGSGRVLPLLDSELGEIIEEQKQARVEGCPYIFHYEGRPLNKGTFGKHWRKVCKLSGVKKLFHDLRRTASRNMDRAGVRQVVRMKIIGHKTTSMDMRYNIGSEKDIQDAIGLIPRTVKKPVDFVKTFTEGAEGKGFEPLSPLQVSRFSRLAPLMVLITQLWRGE